MYDLSAEPTDSPEVKALLKEARSFVERACKMRSTNKVARLAQAFAERKARQ